MRATIEGKFLSCKKGVNKNGKEYVFSRFLIGSQVFNVFGFDGSELAEFDEIVIPVNVFADEKGLRVTVAKVGEGG